jgi:hypothetical protein
MPPISLGYNFLLIESTPLKIKAKDFFFWLQLWLQNKPYPFSVADLGD